MSEKKETNKEPELKEQETEVQESASESAENAETAEELTPEQALQKELEETKAALEKSKKEYLFLLAEFDNFRKRTVREKSDLIKNGAEKAMENLLPVIDDFERALQAISTATDVEGVKEGVDLIYNKFIKYLESNGVKAIESTGEDFNTEFHEAVTTFPAPDESQKGKVIDTVQKGYMINDKVLRHSKVVVGQ